MGRGGGGEELEEYLRYKSERGGEEEAMTYS